MDRDPYDRAPHERDPYERDPYDRGWRADDTSGYRPVRPGGEGGPRSRELPPGADDDEARVPPRRRRRNMPLWQELPLLLIVAFCLAVLIRTFLLQAFYIPSGSMQNTLLVGDRVLVNKIVYDVRDPERGEIVVFRGTDDWAPENTFDTDVGVFTALGRTIGDLIGISQPGEKDFIKRVIGVPGDTVACCDVNGNVYVNGYALDESPYLPDELNSPRDREPSPRECGSRRFNPVTVAPGQIFVLGDHRLVSQDSRCQGQVPIENVIGRAFVVVWPSERWASLGVPTTFANVPKPTAAGPAFTGPIVVPPAEPVAGHPIAVPAPIRPTGVPAGLFVLPALASLTAAARSRRCRWRRPRTLRE